MKQNKYDDAEFFSAYQEMPRSIKGLEAAGEWHVFKALLPDLRNKHVLDLGCGYVCIVGMPESSRQAQW